LAYVFSRDTSAVAPNYTQIAQSGATVALASSDPNLAAQVQAARNAGAKVAIWIPHHDENSDPIAYAQQMAAFAQYYKPDAMLPNVEAQPDGDPQGWNQQMMAEYARLVPPTTGPRVDVVTEPKAGYAFNYKPYVNYGGGAVVEAFHGDMSPVDAAKLKAQLINDGIPEDRINMLFGPNDPQSQQYGGNQSLYTIDDTHADALQGWLDHYSTNVAGKTDTTPSTRTTQGSTPPVNQLPSLKSNFVPRQPVTQAWNLAGIVQAARNQAETAARAATTGGQINPVTQPGGNVAMGVGQFQPAGIPPQGHPPDLQGIAQAAKAVIAQRPDLAGSALKPVAGSFFGDAQQYTPAS
jgi:hypothetical protein